MSTKHLNVVIALAAAVLAPSLGRAQTYECADAFGTNCRAAMLDAYWRQGNFNIGIDNVDFTAGTVLNPFGIPTLDWRGLLVMAALLGLVAAGVLRRRAHDSI